MAKKAKKSAVKKTSKKTKPVARKKSPSKVKATAAKVAASNTKTLSSFQTTLGQSAQVETQRVTEYKLFTEDSVRGLEDQVNYHIKKGWSPVGGVVLQGANLFTQTMVRHGE